MHGSLLIVANLKSYFGPSYSTAKSEQALKHGIADSDWVVVFDTTGHITRIGRILRIRSDLETTTLCFDRILQVEPLIPVGMTSLTLPAKEALAEFSGKNSLKCFQIH